MDKFFNFLFHIYNSLKLLVRPPFSLQIIGLEHIISLAFRNVPQHSHTNHSVGTVQKINHLVSQFGLLIRSFDTVGICIGEKVCSPPQFCVTVPSWFFIHLSCLKSDSPLMVKLCTSQKSLL